MKTILLIFSILLSGGFLQAQNAVIKAGHLFDPGTGKMLSNQIIIVKDGKVQETGSNLKYNSTDNVIDLSQSWVLPGLMDCHVHITFNFNYKNWSYVELYTTESTSLRALRGAFVAEQFLMSGFTTIKEIGNDANYATADIIKAIDRGWIKGPWKLAGIPPSYILQTMTTYAAELLGCEKTRGLLEKSYWADIIALKNNPLEDIEAIRSVHFVMKEGKVVRQE